MLWGMLIWISTSSSGIGDFVHCMNVERRRSPEWLRRHRPAGWPPCITMPQRRPASNRRLGLRPPSPAPLHSSTVAAAYSPMEPAVVPARFPPPRRRHEARNRTAEGRWRGKRRSWGGGDGLWFRPNLWPKPTFASSQFTNLGPSCIQGWIGSWQARRRSIVFDIILSTNCTMLQIHEQTCGSS